MLGLCEEQPGGQRGWKGVSEAEAARTLTQSLAGRLLEGSGQEKDRTVNWR